MFIRPFSSISLGKNLIIQNILSRINVGKPLNKIRCTGFNEMKPQFTFQKLDKIVA